jgi:hypothetical protein
MSSLNREPLSGTIRQGKRIVGGVCLPEQDVQSFIDQFNHCYGPTGMRIEQPAFIVTTQPRQLVPVGAGHYNPFKTKAVLDASQTQTANNQDAFKLSDGS